MRQPMRSRTRSSFTIVGTPALSNVTVAIARRGVEKAQKEHPEYKMQVIVTGQATAAAKALQTTDAKHIYLAGRPGEREALLRSAGVGEFVFAGGDALAVLEDAYRRME